MPEITSAEEFSQIMENCISWDGIEFCGYNSKQCRNIIRSRDSAMLEKYKEVAYKILDGWHETEPGCKWMLTAGQRDDIWRDMKVILDSAFAEIEGGE